MSCYIKHSKLLNLVVICRSLQLQHIIAHDWYLIDQFHQTNNEMLTNIGQLVYQFVLNWLFCFVFAGFDSIGIEWCALQQIDFSIRFDLRAVHEIENDKIECSATKLTDNITENVFYRIKDTSSIYSGKISKQFGLKWRRLTTFYSSSI